MHSPDLCYKRALSFFYQFGPYLNEFLSEIFVRDSFCRYIILLVPFTFLFSSLMTEDICDLVSYANFKAIPSCCGFTNCQAEYILFEYALMLLCFFFFKKRKVYKKIIFILKLPLKNFNGRLILYF